MSAIAVADSGVKQAYRGIYLDFNLNLNLPPPCNTGFLPVRQQRSPSDQDYPERPAGGLPLVEQLLGDLLGVYRKLGEACR